MKYYPECVREWQNDQKTRRRSKIISCIGNAGADVKTQEIPVWKRKPVKYEAEPELYFSFTRLIIAKNRIHGCRRFQLLINQD